MSSTITTVALNATLGRRAARVMVGTCALAGLLVGATVARAGDAANDIAEIFSKDAEMAAAQTRARAAQAKRELERQKIAAEQARIEEQEMLLRARREAEDQKRADAIAAKSGAPPVAIDALDAEKQRKLELDRVATRLRLAREAREAKLLTEATRAAEIAKSAAAAQVAASVPPTMKTDRETPWTTNVIKEPETRPELDPSSRSALGGAGLKFVPDTKVTVLMVLAPGNKGIRRFEKTADPVLCTQDGCYVSAGAAQAAQQKPLHKVLGPGNTFGRRAGECNHALGCVFRGVEIGASSNFLQPVDLKMVIHDRRAQQPLAADRSCRVSAGTLACNHPVIADDYKMWVVPESVAIEAGAAALTRAIADGLTSSRAAQSGVSVQR
jgi:hypothetical protein